MEIRPSNMREPNSPDSHSSSSPDGRTEHWRAVTDTIKDITTLFSTANFQPRNVCSEPNGLIAQRRAPSSNEQDDRQIFERAALHLIETCDEMKKRWGTITPPGSQSPLAYGVEKDVNGGRALTSASSTPNKVTTAASTTQAMPASVPTTQPLEQSTIVMGTPLSSTAAPAMSSNGIHESPRRARPNSIGAHLGSLTPARPYGDPTNDSGSVVSANDPLISEGDFFDKSPSTGPRHEDNESVAAMGNEHDHLLDMDTFGGDEIGRQAFAELEAADHLLDRDDGPGNATLVSNQQASGSSSSATIPTMPPAKELQADEHTSSAQSTHSKQSAQADERGSADNRNEASETKRTEEPQVRMDESISFTGSRVREHTARGKSSEVGVEESPKETSCLASGPSSLPPPSKPTPKSAVSTEKEVESQSRSCTSRVGPAAKATPAEDARDDAVDGYLEGLSDDDDEDLISEGDVHLSEEEDASRKRTPKRKEKRISHQTASQQPVVQETQTVKTADFEKQLLLRYGFGDCTVRIPICDLKKLISKTKGHKKSRNAETPDSLGRLIRGAEALLKRKRRVESDEDSEVELDESMESDASHLGPSTSSAGAKKGSKGAKHGGGKGSNKSKATAGKGRSKSKKLGTIEIDEEKEDSDRSQAPSDEEIMLSPRKRNKKLERLLRVPTSIHSGDDENGESRPRKKKKTRNDEGNTSAAKGSKRSHPIDLSSTSDSALDTGESGVEEGWDEDESDSSTGTRNRRPTRSQRTNKPSGKVSKGDRKRALKELENRRKGRKVQPEKRRRVAVDSDDEISLSSDGDGQGEADECGTSDGAVEVKESPSKVRFRKIMSKNKLSRTTREAESAELERMKRLKQKQMEYNGIEVMVENAHTGDCTYTHRDTVLRSMVKSVVLDLDKGSNPPMPVSVHPLLVRKLKLHQADGIRFLYNSTFESLSRLDEPGGGGILAHCMGLGKTLQVIAYLHTILTHEKIAQKVSKVLIITPKNVVRNWASEFDKWLGDSPLSNSINVVDLSDCRQLDDQLCAIKRWYEHNGPSVLLIGYESFRVLTSDPEDRPPKRGRRSGTVAPNGQQQPIMLKPTQRSKKLEKIKPQLRRYLQEPGPDLVCCDEGHKLKSDESALHRCVIKILTTRRICLTGTPLQNNLMEYYTMVNFVRPDLLGTKSEYRNRFVNVIDKGRSKDADRHHVKAMQRRCHVLYNKLVGVVNRQDYRVLVKEIPPKREWVVLVRLHPRQIALYRHFLANVCRGENVRQRFLADYHVLSRIWTHPHQLIQHDIDRERRREKEKDNEDLRNFIVEGDGEEEEGSDDDNEIMLVEDGTASTSAAAAATATAAAKQKGGKREGRSRESSELPPEQIGWFRDLDLVSSEDAYNFKLSNKLVLLEQIIRHCEECGDKLLIFSQSLESISLIQRMLREKESTWFEDGHTLLKPADKKWGWQKGHDYFVIDGSVNIYDREQIQKRFNNTSDHRARLMLISTRAGSLGTNLVAANRVVIFDVTWNPTHDTQALFRSYRFGQNKPVYVYRLVAQGTMEERVYNRCVTKVATAMRVVDEAQIQRHFLDSDLQELYRFDPDRPTLDESEVGDATAENETSAERHTPRLAMPDDKVLAAVIRSHEKSIVSYKTHDSLFEEQADEQLDDDERAEAWKEYDIAVNSRVATQANALAADPQVPLTEEAVYPHCFRVNDMTEAAAKVIALCQRMFDRLIQCIPEEDRGEDMDCENYLLNQIEDTIKAELDVETLLGNIWHTSDSTINVVANFNEETKATYRALHQEIGSMIDSLLFQHYQLRHLHLRHQGE